MKISEMNVGLINSLWHQSVPATMGGDPEFFIANKRGKIINADAFLPGKDKPITIERCHGPRRSSLFFDGIQAEMAVAYNGCREFFADNIKWCWDEVLKRIPADHTIVLKPATKVQPAVLKQADPEARRFGCSPDFNAYTCSTNTPEMDASRHPFRYAGGHLHFGSSNYLERNPLVLRMGTTEEGHLELVKLFDLLVTIPTLSLDNAPGSVRRRSKYGKAGCFRPTPYGIEYRTPSCWWLRSPMTVSLVYGLGRLAWTIVGKGLAKDFRESVKCDEETVRGVIDESDLKTAASLWENMRPYVARIGSPLGNPLNMASVRTDASDYPKDNYKGFTHPPKLNGRKVHSLAVFEYMLKNGIDSVIGNNIKHEWGIDGAIRYSNGMLNGSYQKMIKNEDFQKFQTSFLTDFFK